MLNLTNYNKTKNYNVVEQKDFSSLVKTELLKVFPVGTIFTSTNSANPSTYLGGTWEQYGKGRCLVGIDTSQTEFKTVGKTGGEKTHTLSSSELPSHTHTIVSNGAHTHKITSTATSAGAHTHNVSSSSGSSGSHSHSISTSPWGGYIGRGNTGFPKEVPGLGPGDYWGDVGIGTANPTWSCGSAGSHTHTISSSCTSEGGHTHTITSNSNSTGAHTHTANSTGGGASHNNLQPYITVYMWRRTA